MQRVTFGKYRDRLVEELLADDGYCNWLLDQDWFWDDRHRDLRVPVAERWLTTSRKYLAGHQDGVDAVWEIFRKAIPPEDYLRIDRQARGCTCEATLTVEDGELTAEQHAEDCGYEIHQRQERQRRETEERHREQKRCKATRKDGKRCKGTAPRGADYCHVHRRRRDDAADDNVVTVDFRSRQGTAA